MAIDNFMLSTMIAQITEAMEKGLSFNLKYVDTKGLGLTGESEVSSKYEITIIDPEAEYNNGFFDDDEYIPEKKYKDGLHLDSEEAKCLDGMIGDVADRLNALDLEVRAIKDVIYMLSYNDRALKSCDNDKMHNSGCTPIVKRFKKKHKKNQKNREELLNYMKAKEEAKNEG